MSLKKLTYLANTEKRTCENCGHEFLRWKKPGQVRASGIRPYHTINCSPKCSREYAYIQGKLNSEAFRIKKKMQQRKEGFKHLLQEQEIGNTE